MKGCKDCPDRTVGCHSKCERYKEFKAECEKKSEARRKDQQGWSDWVEARKPIITPGGRVRKKI